MGFNLGSFCVESEVVLGANGVLCARGWAPENVDGDPMLCRNTESSPGMPARGSKLLDTFRLYAWYRNEEQFAVSQRQQCHETCSIWSNSTVVMLAQLL